MTMAHQQKKTVEKCSDCQAIRSDWNAFYYATAAPLHFIYKNTQIIIII